MPFADILDYAQFTAFIDPDALVAAQDNAIDILEVQTGHTLGDLIAGRALRRDPALCQHLPLALGLTLRFCPQSRLSLWFGPLVRRFDDDDALILVGRKPATDMRRASIAGAL